MPEAYAPIGMTIADETVKETQQPGIPGRPRTVQQDSTDSSEPTTKIPRLYEIALERNQHRIYTSESLINDPRYQYGADIAGALNYVDEWPITRATKRAFQRAMRSWNAADSLFSEPLTDEEWQQIIGARNMKKPATPITRDEAIWWTRMYDSDLVLQKIERSGRNPYVQLLVGSIVGGMADPINVGVMAASGVVGAVVSPLIAAGWFSPALFNATRVGFGARMARLARNAFVQGGLRVTAEASAAAGLESMVADRYDEEFTAGDFAAIVGTMVGFHALALGAKEAFKAIRPRMKPSEVITAKARAEAVVDGMPDADIITPKTVEEYLDVPEPFDDVPINKGTQPKVKNPFQSDAIKAFDEGPQVELVDLMDVPKSERVKRFREGLARREAERNAPPIWDRVRPIAEEEGLVRPGDPLSPSMKDVMRLAVAQVVEGNKRLLQVAHAAIKKLVKDVPKGMLYRGTRLIDTVRKNNLTAAQVRQIVYDLLTRAGIHVDDVRAMVQVLSRDEALSWLNTIISAVRGKNVSDRAPFVKLAGTIRKAPPPLKGTRTEQKLHKALWMAFENPKMADAVMQWLQAIGMELPDKTYFKQALIEASEYYRDRISAGMPVRPLDFLDMVLRQEPPIEIKKSPVERAKEIAKDVQEGRIVLPQDTVPLKTLVGSEDIATPVASNDIRAVVDEIVATSKVAGMAVDEADRQALADLAVGIDQLTAALRVCMRK